VQNFIAKRQLKRGRLNEYTLKVKTAINKEPADFLKAIALERKAETDLLKTYKDGLPGKFVKYWSAYFEYYNYFFIQQYPQIHQIIKLRRYTDTVPPENYIVLKDMPYSFHDSLLQVPSYLLYLTGVVDVKLKAAGYRYLGTDIAKIEAVQDSVNALAFEMMPDRSAEYFAAQTLYGRARSQDLDRTRRQYKVFVDRWPASPYLPDIDRQMAVTARLAKGQPAPDFEFHTADGKPGRLSDLKGKVVFMSFWAGFCKQCIGEMLSEKTIKESIRNKPLEFVYVSIGADTAAERAMMSKLKIDGIFTNVAGGWNSKEAQLYGVQSLPAYFLIDQDGNFGMQNPPPPTQSTRLILEIEKMFR
jgi:peroxiredoxin